MADAKYTSGVGDESEEVSEKTKEKLLKEQKKFEYEEIEYAKKAFKEEIKHRKLEKIYQWFVLVLVAASMGFLAWYLLFNH